MKLQITSDLPEMIQFAKAIVEEKKDYYTDEVLEGIRCEIKRHRSGYSLKEIEDTLYQAIYYYWAYGATTDEFFYLHLYNKSYDEIKTFVTKREKVIYRNFLNRFEDAHLLNNKWETYTLFKEYFGRDVILLSSEADYPLFCDFLDKHTESSVCWLNA